MNFPTILMWLTQYHVTMSPLYGIIFPTTLTQYGIIFPTVSLNHYTTTLMWYDSDLLMLRPHGPDPTQSDYWHLQPN